MVSIGPTIGIKGESAYTNAMKRIIAETKNLDSEMTLLTASFKKNDSAIENNKKKHELLTRQMEGAQRQLLIMKDGLDIATKKQNEAKQAVEKAQKAHEEAVKTYGKESEQAEKTRVAWEKASNQYNITSRDVERFSEKVHLSEAEIEKLKRQMEELPTTTQLVGESVQKCGDKIQEIGSSIESVGSSLTMYLTTPLVTAGTAFVKWASDFTDGMAKIYTIADESKKPMSEMRQELIDLSNASGYSLEDLAEAEYQAVSASVDTGKAVTFLNDATRLARGGFTSTTQAVDLLTTVINAYGYEAEDASYISDVLLRTQNDGKTIIDELAHSMGTVIPTAANYNVSLEQLAAAYATMTKQGVNTSRATTFLNAMFTELEKESSTISKTLDTKMGKSFAQLMDEGYSLAEVLKILYDSVDGDNEQFQRLFGNIRSGKAAAALLTDDFGILNYETERMSDALGQTEKAMEVLETPSLKAKRAIQQLKNSGMELGQTLINEMYPYFLKAVDGVKKLTEWFANLDESTKKSIVNWGLMLAAIGPGLKIIGSLTTGLGSMVSAIGGGIKAIPALTTAFTALTTSGGSLVPLLTSAGTVMGGLIPLLGLLAAGATSVWLSVDAEVKKHEEELQALYGLDEKMKEHIAISQEMEESYNTNRDAIIAERDATLEQVDTAERLIEKYNNLIDSNGEVRKGNEDLADTYLNLLAEALGISREDVEELIEANGRFGESIQKNIEDIKKRAEAAAYEDFLTEAEKRRIEAERQLEQLQGDLVVAHSRVTQAEQKVKDAHDALIDAQERGLPNIDEYTKAWSEAEEQLEVAQQAERDIQAEIDRTNGVVQDAEADTEVAAKRINGTVKNTMRDTANGIRDGGSRVSSEAKSVADDAERKLSIDGYSPGYNAGAGLAKGIRDASWLVEQEAARVSNLASAAMARALRERSPSRVTADIGRYFSEGFAIGIEDSAYKAISAANMLAESAIGGMSMVDPPVTNNTRNITAPITITLNIEGNVDGDDRGFARNIAEDLVNLMNRESEVFA